MAFARHTAQSAWGRRRPVLIATVLAALAALVAAMVVTQPAFAAGTVSATFTSAGDWGTGHQVNVTVTNSGTTAVAAWTLEFDLPAGDTVSSSWDADLTRTGNHYKAVNKSWAGNLAAGASQTWGYIATGPFRTPTACSINGVACTGGTPTSTPTQTPTTTPTPTPTPTPTTTTPPPPGGKKVSPTSPSGACTAATTT